MLRVDDLPAEVLDARNVGFIPLTVPVVARGHVQPSGPMCLSVSLFPGYAPFGVCPVSLVGDFNRHLPRTIVAVKVRCSDPRAQLGAFQHAGLAGFFPQVALDIGAGSECAPVGPGSKWQAEGAHVGV